MISRFEPCPDDYAALRGLLRGWYANTTSVTGDLRWNIGQALAYILSGDTRLWIEYSTYGIGDSDLDVALMEAQAANADLCDERPIPFDRGLLKRRVDSFRDGFTLDLKDNGDRAKFFRGVLLLKTLFAQAQIALADDIRNGLIVPSGRKLPGFDLTTKVSSPRCLITDVYPNDKVCLASPLQPPHQSWLLAYDRAGPGDERAYRDVSLNAENIRQVHPKPLIEIGVAAKPPPKPSKPTDKEVERWLRDRVAGWPDNQRAPTEDDDLQAAREHFGYHFKRDDFRFIRDKATPPEWRTQGPRKPWGQVKARG